VDSALKYFIHILQNIQKLYCFDKVVHSKFCCITVLVGSIQEEVKQFNYLGCELSLDGEPDFDKKKMNRFQGICRTIRKHLKKTRTDTQMKVYKVVAIPSLLYGNETWVTMNAQKLQKCAF